MFSFLLGDFGEDVDGVSELHFEEEVPCENRLCASCEVDKLSLLKVGHSDGVVLVEADEAFAIRVEEELAALLLLLLHLEDMVKFIYDNIQYAEFNTKSDYCHVCGFDGEITINDDLEWECPSCGNKDHSKMNVTRRTCGYLGENFWNVGKTKEINSRTLHI